MNIYEKSKNRIIIPCLMVLLLISCESKEEKLKTNQDELLSNIRSNQEYDLNKYDIEVFLTAYSDGKSILYHTVKANNTNAVSEIINLISSNQEVVIETAMIENAIKNENMELLQLLIQYVELNNVNEKQLLINQYIEYLQSKKLDNAKTLKGILDSKKVEIPFDKNFLFDLCKLGNIEILELYAQGINYYNYVDNNGNNPLFYSIKYYRHPRFLTFLYENGSDIHHINNNGESLLITAAKESQSDTYIEMLIDYGVEINYQDNSGNTALDYAKAIWGNEFTVKLLENAGAISYKTK